MTTLVEQAKQNFLNRDFGKSYQLLIKNLKRNPIDPKANFLLGGLCMTTHKFDLAKKYLSKCLQVKPHEKKFIYQMASLLLMTDQLTQSKQMFQKYLNIHKSNHKVYYSLATIYEHENDFKQAKQNYLKCLQLEPNHQKSRLGIKRLQKHIVQKSEEKQMERETLQRILINLEYKCIKIQEEKQKLLCKKCNLRSSNYASNECGHLILCQQCKDTSAECLICQKPCHYFRVFI